MNSRLTSGSGARELAKVHFDNSTGTLSAKSDRGSEADEGEVGLSKGRGAVEEEVEGEENEGKGRGTEEEEEDEDDEEVEGETRLKGAVSCGKSN